MADSMKEKSEKVKIVEDVKDDESRFKPIDLEKADPEMVKRVKEQLQKYFDEK